jgi:hypothetical protein
MKLDVLPTLLSIAAIASPIHATTVLLTDDFDTASSTGATFNDNLASDQGGSLATVSYTVSDSGLHVQRYDGGMVLNMQGNGWNGAWASLDHNFAADANAANKPLEIQFDMWTDSAAGPSAWVDFSIGSTQGNFFWEHPFGFIVRQSDGQHNYKMVISDTSGTGSGFNGITNGASIEFFIDGVSTGTTAYTLATDGGYLTFRTAAASWGGDTSWGLGHIDNLSVSLVPEPQAALLGAFGVLGLLRRRR